MVEFNGVKYSYAYNLQGDVVGIVDSTGNLVVEYSYDAWGKPISTTANSTLTTQLAELNPFRYRAYVWDEETCLYYLQSRYYNTAEGRFLSKDNTDPFEEPTIGRLFIYSNTYTYCNNSPVSFTDPRGKWFHILVGAIIGAVIGVASAIAAGGDAVDAIISGAAGAAGGALVATGLPVGYQILGSAAISCASNASQQLNHILKGEQKEFDVGDMLVDTAIGALAGAIGGNGASYGSSAHINASGKRLLKNGITGITKKAWRYYATQAHVAGGKFVLQQLIKPTVINTAATIIQIID